MHLSRFKLLTAASLLLLVTACSGVNREAAAELAAAGKLTSQALLDSAKLAQQEIVKNGKRSAAADFLIATLPPVGAAAAFTPPSPDTLVSAHSTTSEHRSSISTLLTARISLFTKLSAAYDEFALLSKDNANTTIQTSITELGGEVNSLIDATNAAITDQSKHISGIKDPITTLVGEGLGLLAEERQKRLILNANAVMLQSLSKVREAANSESSIIASILNESGTAKSILKVALADHGLVTLEDDAADIISLVQAGHNNSQKLKISPHTESAIKAYTLYSAKVEKDIVGSAYLAHIESLNELISAHQALSLQSDKSYKSIVTHTTRLLELARNLRADASQAEEANK